MYWQDFILAKINSSSGFVDCDSKFEHVRVRSEAIMTQEINFALHLCVNAIVIDMPQGPSLTNFSRLIASYVQNVSTSGTRFLLRIEVPSTFEDAELTYQKYLEFKSLIGHACSNVHLILVLGADLPPWDSFNLRWTGEKIHSIQIDTSTFVSNAKGFPVLSKKHQDAIKAFMR
jgi:protein arginine N-methyltransferase 5